jgi:hypothetical protein
VDDRAGEGADELYRVGHLSDRFLQASFAPA